MAYNQDEPRDWQGKWTTGGSEISKGKYSQPFEDYTKAKTEQVNELHRRSLRAALTNDEKQALRSYTEESTRLNALLRGRIDLDEPMSNLERIRHIATALKLDRALSRVELADNVLAYRAIPSQTLAELFRSSSDSVIHDKGFVSTTFNRAVAQGQMEGVPPDYKYNARNFVVVKVDVPKGSSALPLQPHTRHEGEEELLIDRNKKFKIIGEKHLRLIG